MGNMWDKMACCKPGPPLKGGGAGSQYGSARASGMGSGNQGSGSTNWLRDEHYSASDPKLWEYIAVPWLLAVVVLLITVIHGGSNCFWVWFAPFLICGYSGWQAWKNYKRHELSKATFNVLCGIAAFAAFIVSFIVWVHFLEPYARLGSGATYLDVLPSQSAAGASDATAIVFAQGSSVDQQRTFGYVDAKNPTGTVYCVAPISNKFTLGEPTVNFFAAGTDCCGKRSGFGCGEAGSRGALLLATEHSCLPGFKMAVEGAAAAYGVKPANGYVLLTMVPDPMKYRDDKLDQAYTLCLIFAFVYAIIACVTGYLAYSNTLFK